MKKVFLLIVALAVVLAVIGVNLSTLGTYGTPYTIQTKTEGFSYDTGWNANDQAMGPNKPNSPIPTAQNWINTMQQYWDLEMLSSVHPDLIITAWNPQGQNAPSQMVSANGRIMFPNCEAYGAVPGYMPSRFYYKVKLYTAQYPNGKDLVWRGTVAQGTQENIYYDSTLLHVASGSPWSPTAMAPYPEATRTPDRTIQSYDEAGASYNTVFNKYWSIRHTTQGCGYWTYAKPDTFNFALKGAHVGYLEVQNWNMVVDSRDWLQPINWKFVPKLFQTDKIYVLSGAGDFSIRNTAGQIASTFEEGEKAVFWVDTDFSGSTAGTTEGWELRLFNLNTGNEYQRWSIPDNKRAHKIEWTVPTGVWDPTKTNQWRVELWNTLFQQKVDALFTIDDKDKAPGNAVVTFDKDIYYPQDIVTVTFKAQANTAGSGTITSFFWFAYVQGPPPYLPGCGEQYTAQPTHLGGGLYQTSVTFSYPGGDEIIKVKAKAFDGQRHSLDFTLATCLGSDDPQENAVTVKVEEAETGKDIHLAKVVLTGGDVQYTDYDGKAYFRDIQEGLHWVEVSKSGYKTSEKVMFNVPTNEIIYVTLNKGDDIMPLVFSIVIPIVVFVIFLVVSIFIIPPFRYIILILGISLAALLFYILYFTNLLV